LIPINYVRLSELCSLARNILCLSRFLVGEAAGKAPLGVAKKEDVNVNMNQLRGKADSASSVINDTRMVSEERVHERCETIDVVRLEITGTWSKTQ
jgi:hypothetical protein